MPIGAADAVDLINQALQHPEQDIYAQLDRLHDFGQYATDDAGLTWVWGLGEGERLVRSAGWRKFGVHGGGIHVHVDPQQAEQLREAAPKLPPVLNRADPPDHTRVRRLVSHAYTPKRVEQLRPVVTRLLDRVVSETDTSAPIDLLSAVAEPLPTHVIGHLIGLPVREREWFGQLAATQIADIDPTATFERKLAGARARNEIADYLRSLIDERRSDPSDDLISAMIRAEEEGDRLSQDELVSATIVMYLGGFSTTTHLIGNGTVALLHHPDQFAQLVADPSLAPNATNEALRWDTPILTIDYRAGEGAEFEGQPCEYGAGFSVLAGAANRDPRAFTDPSRFDITKPMKPTLMTFSGGIHHCLGMSLARLEGEMYFAYLATRFPGARLEAEPTRAPLFRFRSYNKIEVTLGRAA